MVQSPNRRVELIHGLIQDICNGAHAFDSTRDLAGQRNPGFEVTAKVNLLCARKLAENILDAVLLDPRRALGAQRAQGRAWAWAGLAWGGLGGPRPGLGPAKVQCVPGTAGVGHAYV